MPLPLSGLPPAPATISHLSAKNQWAAACGKHGQTDKNARPGGVCTGELSSIPAVEVGQPEHAWQRPSPHLRGKRTARPRGSGRARPACLRRRRSSVVRSACYFDGLALRPPRSLRLHRLRRRRVRVRKPSHKTGHYAFRHTLGFHNLHRCQLAPSCVDSSHDGLPVPGSQPRGASPCGSRLPHGKHDSSLPGVRLDDRTGMAERAGGGHLRAASAPRPVRGVGGRPQ